METNGNSPFDQSTTFNYWMAFDSDAPSGPDEVIRQERRNAKKLALLNPYSLTATLRAIVPVNEISPLELIDYQAFFAEIFNLDLTETGKSEKLEKLYTFYTLLMELFMECQRIGLYLPVRCGLSEIAQLEEAFANNDVDAAAEIAGICAFALMVGRRMLIYKDDDGKKIEPVTVTYIQANQIMSELSQYLQKMGIEVAFVEHDPGSLIISEDFLDYFINYSVHYSEIPGMDEQLYQNVEYFYQILQGQYELLQFLGFAFPAGITFDEIFALQKKIVRTKEWNKDKHDLIDYATALAHRLRTGQFYKLWEKKSKRDEV